MVKDEMIRVRAHGPTVDRWKRQAYLEGMTLSEWIRFLAEMRIEQNALVAVPRSQAVAK